MPQGESSSSRAAEHPGAETARGRSSPCLKAGAFWPSTVSGLPVDSARASGLRTWLADNHNRGVFAARFLARLACSRLRLAQREDEKGALMLLYFVRHGESVANLTRAFANSGSSHHPLTPRGIKQAQRLTATLSS